MPPTGENVVLQFNNIICISYIVQKRTFPCSAASVCPVSRRPHVCRRPALSVRRFFHLQAPRTVRCSNICWPSCTTLRREARSADNAVPPIPSLIVPNHRRRCSSVKITFTMTKMKKMENDKKIYTNKMHLTDF